MDDDDFTLLAGVGSAAEQVVGRDSRNRKRVKAARTGEASRARILLKPRGLERLRLLITRMSWFLLPEAHVMSEMTRPCDWQTTCARVI